ncbi:sensor histidine kinase YesM [Rhabdobacter roseus]|uniref:Sensor histidine kinase YesM n=1 Tax=Rhabdobacter roseus TaxID=1655419 RepID=A0A840TR04_9BACT|nr:histidine kinase [Rhabdobacter roseus]MBB5285754.1 sensor histidine kinase YesM [Rhabdobacter roseus]
MATITDFLRMHWLRFLRRTKWQYLLLVPWYVVLASYFFVGDRYLHEPKVFVLITAFNFLLVSGVFISLDYLIEKITTSFPDLRQTRPRVLWTLLAVIGVTTGAVLSSVFLYDYFSLFGYIYNPESLQKLLLMNLVANLISIGIYESFYTTDQWREHKLENEQLEKSNLQSQLDSLKSQVNPHFLFNSLNSLSSLIAEEPAQAERFVDELSKVYRYLLQTNQAELTTLATELAFIQSYTHLLTTRYGQGVLVTIDVPEPYQSTFLPPLTLQLLVENAVKHNVTLASRPLHILIGVTPEGQLMVRNNLQKRVLRVPSNQVGLSNITLKYRLLTQRPAEVPPTRVLQGASAPGAEIFIEESEQYFTVLLPLLHR